MKVLDLFAGTRSISKAFERHGHEVYSVDWDKRFEGISLYADISTLTANDIVELCGGRPDVIWASPDCSTYSIAAISKHRVKDEGTGNLIPISDYAKFCDGTNEHVLHLIVTLRPKYFFIEKDVVYGEFTALYSNVLSVWRYAHETYRYMDKPPKPTV